MSEIGRNVNSYVGEVDNNAVTNEQYDQIFNENEINKKKIVQMT